MTRTGRAAMIDLGVTRPQIRFAVEGFPRGVEMCKGTVAGTAEWVG